jgi:polysaccharide deacetylase family protein (PEP-CTERM system associated)
MQSERSIRSFRQLDTHEPVRLASKDSGRGAISTRIGNGKAALSIDVEDWFHTANLEGVITRNTWGECELRVERNTMRMIEILATHNARATFFVLGWVAERCPQLVREIAAAGHEVASHGYDHERVYSLRPSAFRSDVMRSKQCLEDLTGKLVRGYRAPCFSITDWAIPILHELGFDYDSSFVPSIAHDRYGALNGIPEGQAVVPLRDGFYEICISCIRAGKFGIPWGGGGYFRLLPYWLWRRGVRMILCSGMPYVFYIHPWEIDESQPRVAGMRPSDAFRQHVNLQRCEQRFSTLVSELEWMTLSELVDAHHSAVRPSATRGAVQADHHRGPTESGRM